MTGARPPGRPSRRPGLRLQGATSMRGAVIHAPGDVRVEEREDPKILKPTDAIIRLAATCVCGSDLWPYRGVEPFDGPTPMGHEYVGFVEEVGTEVTTVAAGPVRGRLVLRLGQHLRELPRRLPVELRPPRVRWARWAPRRSCSASRSPTAPWSPPRGAGRGAVPSLLAASDVLGTGWFAAVAAAGRARQDGRGRRRRRGRPARRARGAGSWARSGSSP